MDVLVWRSRLLTSHWFNDLPVKLQDCLWAAAKVRRLTAGQRLFKRGDPPCGLYAILEGSVHIGTTSVKTRDALAFAVDLPYWFGEVSLFDGLPRTQDAFAVGPTIVLQVPQTALLTLLESHPHYWQYFAQLLGRKVQTKCCDPRQPSALSTVTRVAHRLLLVLEGYGQLRSARQVAPLSIEELAASLSLSCAVTELALGTLGQGCVLKVNAGEIEILDLQRLREAASA